ncbi:hypothetical protein NECAME_13730 [Necator americanus]|uniref:Uncharacterized protein n=1 Tax=Necator americanus TaxID=51031 RepID=W2ST52_NECAM|nr:hypothetical protein NECAME_13730 [Necator americanus]ETN72780.1 hypothetical protein NECAME_13730 [Necator americanus]
MGKSERKEKAQAKLVPVNNRLLDHAAEKAAERFEAQTIELSNKVEDLNRHVNDLAQQRQRLQAENNDLLKKKKPLRPQLEQIISDYILFDKYLHTQMI